MMSVTPGSCPGKTSPSCTCSGTCRFAPASGCACPACLGQLPVLPGGGPVSPGISGSGSPAGSIGVAGQLSSVGPAPRGTGSGMTGFAEVSSQEFEFEPKFDMKPVVGLRQWTLDGPDFRGDPHEADQNWPAVPMRGATGFSWPAGVLEAYCNNGYSHPPPTDFDPATGARCGCGVWAYWDMTSLAANRSVISGSGLPVLGAVEGYGRVLLGEKGFRSQKAKIVALALAFSIRAELSWPVPPDLPEVLSDHPHLRSDPYLAYAAERRTAEETQVKAQRHADAWLAVIQDRLGQLYPGAQVYATVGGLLASVQPRGKPS